MRVWIIIREDDNQPGSEIFQVHSTKRMAEARMQIEQEIVLQDKQQDTIHFHLKEYVVR